MQQIILKKSIFQALKLLVLSGIFVVLGIFIITSKDKSHWIGWMNLVFFGSAFLLGFFQLFDRRAQLIADENGLFDRMNLHESIAWSSVEKMTVMKSGFLFSKQAFVMVELKPFSGETLSSKIKKRLFAKRQKKGKAFLFSISLTPLEGKASETFEKLIELQKQAAKSY
ncbi:hypothetical protein HUK80_05890 [Flavobacterium sp. MAH-1]|uniref:Uncharacterized protein n=1 Tax=Flavobacterium agri TaxID=2743471 RepID=A0A7Y9C5I8_9FLAO|nr:STM3941 family protein [Flavobacterium agri]NUY80419.1 hypothetical protein [Flavobacterium agri]NYA70444.1 hypothetical protein [Flavobacterium agri]